MSSTYLVALGSNRRHHRYGQPRDVVRTAMEELTALGTVGRRSPIIDTPPMGPAQRRFANAAVLLETELDPQALLAALKWMEQEFGRRKGRRWGDRVLDLDIILWSEGSFRSAALTIPHPEFRQRSFVLGPAKTIASGWRDPLTGRLVRVMHARLAIRRTKKGAAP